jgi:hypothetical protein
MKSKFALLSTIFVLLSACSQTKQLQCEYWRNQGVPMGTIDSCKECISTLGISNPNAVGGCSLGLDAASMMEVNPIQNSQ